MCDLKIVGVTRTSCSCFEPDSITPLSGLYLSELEGFDLQKVADTEDCLRGDYEEITLNALEQAWQLTQSEVIRQIALFHDFEKRPDIHGVLGKEDKHKFATPQKSHYVLRFMLNNLKDTVININAITAMFQNSGTVNISVYDSYLTHKGTATLTVTGGLLQRHTLSTPIVMNCQTKGLQYSQYFLVFESTLKPMMFGYKCCGDKYYFDCHKPYFDLKAAWRQLLNFGYNQIDFTALSDLEALRCEGAECDYMPGVLLDITSTCSQETLTCSTGIDYAGDFGMSIALAIRYKAAGIIYTDILNRNSPEKVNPDDMVAALQLWDAKFAQHCTFIAQSEDILKCDCFKKKGRMIKQRLR